MGMTSAELGYVLEHDDREFLLFCYLLNVGLGRPFLTVTSMNQWSSLRY